MGETFRPILLEGSPRSSGVICSYPAPPGRSQSRWIYAFGWLTTFLRVSDPLQKMSPSRSWLPRWDFKARTTVERWGMWGPCPPSGKHRYFFGLFALDKELDLPPGASHQQVTSAMENHQLGVPELMGTYARKSERAA